MLSNRQKSVWNMEIFLQTNWKKNFAEYLQVNLSPSNSWQKFEICVLTWSNLPKTLFDPQGRKSQYLLLQSAVTRDYSCHGLKKLWRTSVWKGAKLLACPGRPPCHSSALCRVESVQYYINQLLYAPFFNVNLLCTSLSLSSHSAAPLLIVQGVNRVCPY